MVIINSLRTSRYMVIINSLRTSRCAPPLLLFAGLLAGGITAVPETILIFLLLRRSHSVLEQGDQDYRIIMGQLSLIVTQLP